MIEFWWSSGENRKKIAWVSWQKLCKSKELGGLGFNDMEKFNQTLLAKQSWRVLDKPKSLLARVSSSDTSAILPFWKATLGSRPSFAWRSMLHGRELLQQGLVKRIGAGSRTSVWWEKWIVDSVPRVPDYRPGSVIDLTLKVEDLLEQNSHTWNQTLVRQTFSQKDAHIILKIKTHPSKPDYFEWGLTKNGVYSSKSGYDLIETLEELNSPATSTTPPLERKLWSDL